MNAIEVRHLTYRYGRSKTALSDLHLQVPEGSVYALLGPNGSGKTTLMQILAGMRPVPEGVASVLGIDVRHLSARDREQIGYVAEGLQLPKWMRLEQYEAYLAPLYPSWDFALANALRARFSLDAKQKLGSLSRGTAMKAALLCALAPRPKLLLMDEPFTGMDALVKDELVRGLLDTAASDGWTVFVCSHDIAEVESLCDSVGLLKQGRMVLSESMDSLHARFRRVEITSPALPEGIVPADALQVERAGSRTSFVVSSADALLALQARIAPLTDGTRLDAHGMSLRDVFVAAAGDWSTTAGATSARVA